MSIRNREYVGPASICLALRPVINYTFSRGGGGGGQHVKFYYYTKRLWNEFNRTEGAEGGTTSCEVLLRIDEGYLCDALLSGISF